MLNSFRNFFINLRQYLTIQMCGLRSQIFRQSVQILRRQPDGVKVKFARNYVKDASKARAVNCAVLP